MSNIKICSLNTQGINGNWAYINQLISIYDICFISEHWLNKYEENVITTMIQPNKEDAIASSTHECNSIKNNMKYFFHTSCDIERYKGRPFGGLIWLYRENIEIINCEFHNDNVTNIVININGKKICIIGVYLTYNNEVLLFGI